jgi:hypothetical protein
MCADKYTVNTFQVVDGNNMQIRRHELHWTIQAITEFIR